jgi:hypothetical protein
VGKFLYVADVANMDIVLPRVRMMSNVSSVVKMVIYNVNVSSVFYVASLGTSGQIV